MGLEWSSPCVPMGNKNSKTRKISQTFIPPSSLVKVPNEPDIMYSSDSHNESSSADKVKSSQKRVEIKQRERSMNKLKSCMKFVVVKRLFDEDNEKRSCYELSDTLQNNKMLDNINYYTEFNTKYELNKKIIKEFNAKSEIKKEIKTENNAYTAPSRLDDKIICIVPKIVAEISYNLILNETERLKFKYMMNSFEENNNEIKNDYTNYGKNKGKIHDIIDPSKHLSSLFIDNENIKYNENYHKWIPSVFQFNYKNDSIKMGEIANLDLYSPLNKLIGNIFKKMIPLFENVLNLNLDLIPLKCIVKARSYILSGNDIFTGNMHKDGIFEDIIATGCYYYDINQNIEGGSLQLNNQIKDVNYYDFPGHGVSRETIKIKEGRCIVFNNYLCYHKEMDLFLKNKNENKTYSKKVLSFFLLNPNNEEENHIDSNMIVTNWKMKMIQITTKWWGLDSGYKWLFDVIGEYMVGTKQFIQQQTQKYKKCRTIYARQFFQRTREQL
eukprot:502155_1